MELLNFYSKILPDELFKKKKLPESEKSIDKAFQHIVNKHVSESKIDDNSWLQQFNPMSFKHKNFDAKQNVNSENMKFTNIEALNFNYNVVKDKDFKHNNMYHNKGGYTIIQGEIIPQPVFNKNPIIENFLGSSYDRIPIKQEVPNMFKPEEGVFSGNRIPVDTDGIRSRIVTSDRRNDALLTEPQRVPPGLGRDPNDNSQRGIHPLVRILPPGVDQLRNANHQKVTYKSDITPGQMGISKRPQVAPFEKRTADTFMVDRPVEKGRSTKTEIKKEGEYDIKPTGRDMHNKPYSGPAYSSSTYSSDNRLAYTIEESNRNQLREPEPFGPTSVVKAQTVNDPSSILLQDTQRQTMAHNTYKAVISGPVAKSKSVNYFDMPKDTIRQTTSVNTDKSLSGASRSTYGNKQVVFDPTDAPKDTIRQTTSVNKDHRGASGAKAYSSQQYVYNPSDVPKDTIKQTTITNPNQLGYIMSAVQVKGTAFNPNDLPKSTVKETTIYKPENFGTVARSQVPQSQAFNPFDPIRETTKESTQFNSENLGSIVGGGNKFGSVAFDPNDVPKDTIKQTTSVNKADKSLSGASRTSYGNKQVVYDPTDVPKDTIRQTTSVNKADKSLSGASRTSYGNKQVVYDPTDVPKDTIKQTTLLQNYVSHGHLYTGDGKGYISNPQEFKTTQRQINTPNVNFNQGGSMAQSKKAWVAEPENIAIRDCRNEIHKGEEKHYPTNVSLAHIPQVNTTGSMRLPHVVVDNRAFIANRVNNVPCSVDTQTGIQPNLTPSRELSLLNRVIVEAKTGEEQRNLGEQTEDLGRTKQNILHDYFIQY